MGVRAHQHVVAQLQRAPDLQCTVVATGQHREMFRQVADLFGFTVDADLEVMRPNQTLVLEAHRQIMIGNEAWEYSLSGVCRAEDIGPDNIILSRNISELMIQKRERGHIRDSYKRGAFTRLLDRFNPF